MTDVVDSATSDEPAEGSDIAQPTRRGRQPLIVALVVVLSAISVALTVLAYNAAKTSTSTTHFTVFWVAVAALLAAAAIGGVRLPDNRYALPLLLVLIGLVTYVPKFLMSMTHPAYFDEYAHLRHAQDMLATGNLGASNDLLPVIQYYPGLGTLTLGVHYVTGLNLWHSGQVVIVIAHCATLVLIYAVTRCLRLPRRIAFLAAMIYAANPGYLYFDSQYAYESLAIPLLLLAALFCVRSRRAATAASAYRNMAGGVLAATATLLTHHVSSAIMALLCLLITLFVPRRRDVRDRGQLLAPVYLTLWAVLAVVAWNLLVSTGTRKYVLPSLTTGFSQLVERLTGSAPTQTQGQAAQGGPASSQRSLFQGSGAPHYEVFFAYAVPVLVLLATIFTLVRLWRSANRRAELRSSAPFFVLTLGYLASLPLALTTTGNQAAHRSWPFFFIGVAIYSVWSLGRELRPSPGMHRPREFRAVRTGVVAFVVLMVLTIGNVAAGANIAYRFPGPYVFGEDNRFRTTELTNLVDWSASNLPKGAHVVTDRFTAQELIVGTTLHIPTNNESYAYTIYQHPSDPPQSLRTFLRSKGIRYFILDRRILTTAPVQVFFQGYAGTSSTNLRALASIQDNDFIRQIHSTKNYRVYEIAP